MSAVKKNHSSKGQNNSMPANIEMEMPRHFGNLLCLLQVHRKFDMVQDFIKTLWKS